MEKPNVLSFHSLKTWVFDQQKPTNNMFFRWLRGSQAPVTDLADEASQFMWEKLKAAGEADALLCGAVDVTWDDSAGWVLSLDCPGMVMRSFWDGFELVLDGFEDVFD